MVGIWILMYLWHTVTGICQQKASHKFRSYIFFNWWFLMEYAPILTKSKLCVCSVLWYFTNCGRGRWIDIKHILGQHWIWSMCLILDDWYFFTSICFRGSLAFGRHWVSYKYYQMFASIFGLDFGRFIITLISHKVDIEPSSSLHQLTRGLYKIGQREAFRGNRWANPYMTNISLLKDDIKLVWNCPNT